MFLYEIYATIKSPELALEMMVFITIWFFIDSFLTSLVTLMLEPAFIKSEHIRMIKVPAMRKLILLAKYYLFEFSL
jgi:hypothetical protein